MIQAIAKLLRRNGVEHEVVSANSIFEKSKFDSSTWSEIWRNGVTLDGATDSAYRSMSSISMTHINTGKLGSLATFDRNLTYLHLKLNDLDIALLWFSKNVKGSVSKATLKAVEKCYDSYTRFQAQDLTPEKFWPIYSENMKIVCKASKVIANNVLESM